MESEYTLKEKKNLAKKIGKITSKKDLCNIYKIIKENNTFESKEVNKHLFMYFHNFSNDTYREIDKYINTYKKKKKREKKSNRTSDLVSTDEYIPYSIDDIASQKDLSPKLKYSNKEKSIIKRRIYNNKLNKHEPNVVYCNFNKKSSKTICN